MSTYGLVALFLGASFLFGLSLLLFTRGFERSSPRSHLLGLLAIFAAILGIGYVAATLQHSPGRIASNAALNGLPLPADYRMIPALTPTGQQVQLDAQMYPVLFFDRNDGAALQRIETAYARIRGVKRPLVLVRTLFHTQDQAAALQRTRAFLQGERISAPWALQLGSAVYAHSSPELVWITPQGTVVRSLGLPSILADLHRAAGISTQPAGKGK